MSTTLSKFHGYIFSSLLTRIRGFRIQRTHIIRYSEFKNFDYLVTYRNSVFIFFIKKFKISWSIFQNCFQLTSIHLHRNNAVVFYDNFRHNARYCQGTKLNTQDTLKSISKEIGFFYFDLKSELSRQRLKFKSKDGN